MNKPLFALKINRESGFGRILLGPVGALLSFAIGASLAALVVFLAAIGGLPTAFRGGSAQAVSVPPEQMGKLLFVAVPVAILAGFACVAGWYIWKTSPPPVPRTRAD